MSASPPSPSPTRVAIVGGGLLGLTVAHRLHEARPEASITVFEAAPEAGGLASAWSVGPVMWDRFYHVTLASDSAARELLRELDLEDEIEWKTTRTGCWANGRVTPLGTPAEFLRSPVLGPVGKGRLIATILWGGRVRNWQRLEQTPVSDWLTRWSGRSTFRRFWLPLLRAKLGDGWPRANAAFIWATIQRLSAARRNGLGEERFGYVRGTDGQPGGYARTISALGRLLAADDIEVRCGAKVEAVDHDAAGALVVRVDGSSQAFDDVIVTVAPPVAAKLCVALPDAERATLAAIPYQGVVCTSMVLRRPLAGFYLTYLVDDVPITTVIEMSSLVDPAEYGGHSLVYIPSYVSSEAPILDASDDEIAEVARSGLRAVHPDVKDDDIVAVRTARARYVFPLPVLGYSDTVPAVETSVSGLHLVSSAQIVNGTLNANETITLANTAAPRLRGSTPVDARGGVMTDGKPIASLSFDLDNLWAYRMTHGDHDWSDAPTYLPVVSDRILELLDDLGLHITFFVVGRDAADERNGDALRALAVAGHEIGNHSYDHRPWMHRWSRAEIDDDIGRAEEAITAVAGSRPVAFRGPGYSLSGRTIDVLVERGYRYDCSTLPTFIGPFARWFYFRGADLDAAQRDERRELFGSWRDGLRPIKPYAWRQDGHQLTELPLTTVPFARIPCHVSYLLTLAGFSPRAADLYWQTALSTMRRSGVTPSILLHPLDLLGPDDAPGLSFFPGMGLSGERKRVMVRRFLGALSERFDVVPCASHVERATASGLELPSVPAGASAPSAPLRPLLAGRDASQ